MKERQNSPTEIQSKLLELERHLLIKQIVKLKTRFTVKLKRSFIVMIVYHYKISASKYWK